MKWWVVLVVVVFSSWSRAQTLTAAEGLYADGELSDALKAADAALKKAPDAAETAKLQVLRGLVFHAQNKKDPARAAFALALEADATTTLDAQRVPPTALSLFEQARESVAPGTVSVSVSFPDATLLVDDVDYGPLPLTAKLPVGRHSLLARDSSGRSAAAEVLVKSGRTSQVELKASGDTASAPPPPPPLVSSEEGVSVGGLAPATQASLLEPAAPVKQTWWGLIPLVVAAGVGWLPPPLAVSPPYLGLGFTTMAATTAVVGFGVALLAGSAVTVEASQGLSPSMNWWGLIPLAAGLICAVAAAVLYANGESWSSAFMYGAASATIGVGSGLLIGRAVALASLQPRVSTFILKEGAGVALSATF